MDTSILLVQAYHSPLQALKVLPFRSQKEVLKGKQSVERNEGLEFEKWTSPKRDEYLLEGRGSKGLAVL